MDLKELKSQVESDLDKAVISSMTLLDRFNFLDDKSKNTGAYFNPRYIPFYYHLGKRMSCQNLLHVGFGIGLASGVFLMGCSTVEKLLAIQIPSDSFYSPRLGIKNIKAKYKKTMDCFVGEMNSDEFKTKLKDVEWEVVLMTETTGYDQHRSYFDIVWDNMKYNGLLVVDYINSHESNRRAYNDFCKIVNREPLVFDTRYGVGIIQR